MGKTKRRCVWYGGPNGSCRDDFPLSDNRMLTGALRSDSTSTFKPRLDFGAIYDTLRERDAASEFLGNLVRERESIIGSAAKVVDSRYYSWTSNYC